LWRGFGVGLGCHAISGIVLGSRIGGTEPISCSSKHSSAITFVVTDPFISDSGDAGPDKGSACC
jgi:hypothetical protein